MVLPYTPRRDTQNHALPLFVNPDDSPDRYPAPPLGMTVGSEIKKLIVSTCRSIVKLEASLKKPGSQIHSITTTQNRRYYTQRLIVEDASRGPSTSDG